MTLNVNEQPRVTITDSAVNKILSLMSERELEGHYLRLIVDGLGCSGSEYGMAFSEDPREGDTVFNSNGLRVLVDAFSLMCLDGATVDFVDTPEGSDFRIDNPNEAQSSTCSSCSQGCG